jgi:hypothetical protein
LRRWPSRPRARNGQPAPSPFALLTPRVGAVFSFAFGERFGPLRIGGIALMLVGLAIVSVPIERLKALRMRLQRSAAIHRTVYRPRSEDPVAAFNDRRRQQVTGAARSHCSFREQDDSTSVAGAYAASACLINAPASLSLAARRS